MIHGDFKSQVLGQTDIVQLISQSVALKRRGKDFLGLCPFHTEKSPSFHVSPTKQTFHCFGCKAGGTAIDFVMRRDRVEFKEALRILADMAGLEMPDYRANSGKPDQRKALLEAHSAACAFYEQILRGEGGRAAREYLQKRGFTDETIRKFQIGLAPDAWEGLLKGPVGRKYGQQLLVTAGLAKQRLDDAGNPSNGAYDAFRNRIMFPIRDEVGRIIAFGGRVMPGSPEQAKYLNSPETPLFSKGRCAFGLDLAKHRISQARTVAVVEGYTDVAMAHQYGVSNVVSILGTAMTEHHVTLLRRFADKIVLLFDADAAGDKAAQRVLELFLTQPVDIAIAQLPDGLDPDEFLLQRGADAFEQAIAQTSDVLAYQWRLFLKQFSAEDEQNITGRQKAVEHYLSILSQARGQGGVDAIRWGQALARVSRLAAIPIEELHRRFKDGKSSQRSGMQRGTARFYAPKGQWNASRGGDFAPRPTAGAGMEGADDPQGSETGAAAPPARNRPLNATDRAQRCILGLLLLEPRRWHDAQVVIGPRDFTDPRLARLADIYWCVQRDEAELVFSEFLALLAERHGSEPDLAQLALELTEHVESLPDNHVAFADSLGHLEGLRRLSEERKLLAALRRTSGEQGAASQEAASDDAVSGVGVERADLHNAAPAARGADARGEPAGQSPDGSAPEFSDDGAKPSQRHKPDKLALLQALVKKNQATNLPRLGPLRRSGS